VANQQVSEMWLAGVHSDIGGGYPESSGRLWAITLEWMMDHARTALQPGGATLVNDPARWQEIKSAGQSDAVAPDYASAQHSSLTWGWTGLELYRNLIARSKPTGHIRPSYVARDSRRPSCRPRKLRAGEHVHRSAIERFVARSDYRPPTLCNAG